MQGENTEFPRDLKGYGENTPDPQWPNGAKIAISFVINYEGKVTTESILVIKAKKYI
jgi:hypothetical protein